MNALQGKVWGNTRPLFFKNKVEIHRIEAKDCGFCSKHCHEYKHNLFFVESGKLQVTVWKNDYNLIDDTIISAGEATTVPPKEYHSFMALEDTVAFEIYWVELLEKDILREDCGGTSPS